MLSDTIKQKLVDALDVSSIEIIDETHKHKGHPQSSGGHFRLIIVSSSFEDFSLIERHRLIYKILDNMMKKEIHALSISANTPAEI